MYITAYCKMFPIRNMNINKRWQFSQQISYLQHNLVCISVTKKLTLRFKWLLLKIRVDKGKIEIDIQVQDSLMYTSQKQDVTTQKCILYCTGAIYLLCRHFCFLKSSIIFFTKSNVTTSPSIRAPAYCGSTSRVEIEHKIIVNWLALLIFEGV